MANETTQDAVATEVDAAAPAAAPELTIVDLQNLRQVVDLATRRGAFAAAEMSSVGAVFDKLNVFLNAMAPAANAESAPAAEKAA